MELDKLFFLFYVIFLHPPIKFLPQPRPLFPIKKSGRLNESNRKKDSNASIGKELFKINKSKNTAPQNKQNSNTQSSL